MNFKIIVSGLLISVFSISASAGHKSGYGTQNYYNEVSTGQYYDFAKVKSVSPIIETIEHRIPRQCNYRQSNNTQHRSATPIILGSIIGAAIGNELGHHKSNKRVGVVAGGILGASIGADIGKKHHHTNTCNQYDIEYEERVVGYDVNYYYRGNSYHTTTREHPGKKLKLRLQFEPVASLYN